MPIAVNDKTGAISYLAPNGQWLPAQVAQDEKDPDLRYAWDGKEWKQFRFPSMTPGEMGAGLARSAASGATGGWADEIEAGVKSMFNDKSYDKNYQETSKTYDAIPPRIGIPGEIAGGVLGAVAVLPAANAARVAQVPSMVRGLLGGTVGGAISGAGHAKPGQRAGAAAVGGGIGAGIGAVVPGAMSVGGAIFRPDARAAVDVGRAIARDGMTPSQLTQRAIDLGQTRPGVATIADAGGENLLGLVERIAQTPGAGRTVLTPWLKERQAQQGARLGADLREGTGVTKGAWDAIEETTARMKQDAKPLYDAAYNFNARAVPEIADTWARETAQGYGRALMQRPAFRRMLQTEYGVADAAEAPLMKQIDVWKRVADDFIRANRGSNEARVVQQMRDRVVGVVDKHNSDYPIARSKWAGDAKFLDAIDGGKDILNKQLSPEELAARFGKLSDAEKEGFRVGAVSSLINQMKAETAKLPDQTKHVRSPLMREKIAAIMPTPEAAEKWGKRIDFETNASELTTRALGGSPTARRLMERQDAENIATDLIADAFMGAKPIGLIQKLVGASGLKYAHDKVRSRTDKAIAEILTGQKPLGALIDAVKQGGNVPPSVLRAGATGGAIEGLLGAWN